MKFDVNLPRKHPEAILCEQGEQAEVLCCCVRNPRNLVTVEYGLSVHFVEVPVRYPPALVQYQESLHLFLSSIRLTPEQKRGTRAS